MSDRATLPTPSWQFGPPEAPECECEPTSDCCVDAIDYFGDVAVCVNCNDPCGLKVFCHCEADEDDRREDAALARAEEKEEMYR